MITYILILFAAVFKAVADTLDDHFDTSIFKHLPWQFWDANRATTKKFWFTGYKPDAWHICGTLYISLFAFAAVFNDLTIAWWKQVLIIGTEYNLVFGLFYSKILRRKSVI